MQGDDAAQTASVPTVLKDQESPQRHGGTENKKAVRHTILDAILFTLSCFALCLRASVAGFYSFFQQPAKETK